MTSPLVRCLCCFDGWKDVKRIRGPAQVGADTGPLLTGLPGSGPALQCLAVGSALARTPPNRCSPIRSAAADGLRNPARSLGTCVFFEPIRRESIPAGQV